jgi:hypothetical protein
MPNATSFRVITIASVLALALMDSTAFAGGTVLTLPATGTGAVDGSGLTVTNTENYPGTGGRPWAITGIASGTTAGGVFGDSTNTDGYGVYGEATQANSIGVFGENTGTGDAGYFLLDGASTVLADTAIYAENRGGSTTTPGNYGTGGYFAVTNAMNQSSAIYATTNGTGWALAVEQTGAGASAVDFDTNNPKNASAGLFVTTEGTGSAGDFEIFNPENAETGLVVKTDGTGSGIVATIADTTNVGASAVAGIDNSSPGSFTHAIYGRSNNNVAVYGISSSNVSAQFKGGSSGTGVCSYTGGSGWNCTSDRNLKEAFVPVATGTLLDHLAAMPVFTYRMKGARDKSVFLGPTAQDFMAAFHLGDGDDTKINEANAIGVALAAAKGVYAKLRQDEATIAADHDKIAALERQLTEQKAAMTKAVQNEDRLTRLEAAIARFSQVKSSRVEAGLNTR